ncbi:sugar phosphate isomerase/epimerase family protein [Tropicimonas isoalkanivorans]|uniref:Xylose isomerase-like TIM barrel n=1 Tax=Tropicimonas isoalkanivorans TaxID=441112 RepID=A0A1I1DSF6_9RHOB|nr:TIM barrel protein [Tropicimonas isoalkanivorans]SFB77959.1 Xylose isomerase-like TIM barrel [Tropicimonas isoalkanivorans]
MKLGLNLSFAIKRWLGGERLAALVANELETRYVQFTWDLVDPDWPASTRDTLAREYATAFAAAGVTVESTFGGLASYTFNHILAPTPELRALGKAHLRNAIDMTAAMEVPAAGMPLGSFSADDAVNPARREEIYKMALEAYVDLARHAREQGLSMLLVEPVPLATEFPASAEEALRLMTDLDGQTDVPVRLCVDWGHAMFKPLFGEKATMEHWMEVVGNYIATFHIQQHDGLYDRHWNFTRDGLITPQILSDFWDRHELDEQTYFLEIIYPFEEPDAVVLEDMKAAMKMLRSV